MGGGGRSSGGGTSGKVDYPTYMKEVHEDWLRQAADTIDESVTDAMNTALANSPFTGAAAYDPTGPVGEISASPGLLQTLVTLLSSGTALDDLIDNVLDESRITGSVTAFAADLVVQADAEVYPRFEAGMRDINAVMSSAFVIGRANIANKIVAETAKYEGSLRYQAWGADSIAVIGMKLNFQQAVSQMTIEANRLEIVAYKEQSDSDIKYDEADATWDLEVFQYGSNVMACIAGAALSAPPKQPSTAQSMIGGALSAGAMGYMMAGAKAGGVTGPQGAMIGAGVGAVAALGSTMF